MELVRFVQRVINGATNSHSYLQFSDLVEFNRFLKFALEITRIGEWQVTIDLPRDGRSEARKQWRNTHSALFIGFSEQYVSSNKFKSGRARLYFQHPHPPSTELDGERQRYSSNLIKYVCHVLAIMIPDVLSASEELGNA